MSNAMFCDPVEKPVPTKNSANPKFLKALRQQSEIKFGLEFLQNTEPMNNPVISVQAVVPKDNAADVILMFPIILPKRAVRQIRINSG